MGFRMYRALVLLLAAAALVSTRFAASAAGRSTSKAALRLVQRTPLEVQGVHFKLRERVRVTATTDTERVVRRVRTTRRGRFLADFGFDACKTTTVKAVGARGDRATLVVEPPPPPPGADRACFGL